MNPVHLQARAIKLTGRPRSHGSGRRGGCAAEARARRSRLMAQQLVFEAA